MDRACSFLDNVTSALKKQIKALDEYIKCSYEVTHAFHRFGYGFDAEEEGTTSGELLHAVSSVGSFGTLLRTTHEQFVSNTNNTDINNMSLWFPP